MKLPLLKLYLAALFSWLLCDKAAFRMLCNLKASGVHIKGVDLLRARIRFRQGRTMEAMEMLKEELRLFPENKEALAIYNREKKSMRKPVLPSQSDDLQSILEMVLPFTMLSVERLEALYTGAREICARNIPGNFVECGVCAGGSSALLGWVIRKYSKERRLIYCFDTFEGMPVPTPDDKHAGIPAEQTGWGHGTCAAPITSLLEVAAKVEALEVIRPIKGLFQETLPRAKKEIGPVALLHLDGDWYDSTKAILSNLYVQTQVGAYLQIDDYGHWEGCRKAVEEFQAEIGVEFPINTIDSTGVCFRKP